MRFPEFSGEWREKYLGQIAEITKSHGISKEQLSAKGSPCILYGELYTKYKFEIINDIYSKTTLNSSRLVKSQANDVIIPCSGETAIDISTARCVPYNNILLGGDLNIIRLQSQDGGFFAYQLNGVRKREIACIAQGVSVVHLYGENLRKIKVYYPSIEEQRKITSLLLLIDKRISTQNKIIEDLEQLKSAIRERLYTQIQEEDFEHKTIKDVLSYEHPTKYIVVDTEYTDDKKLTPVLTANKAFILGYTPEQENIYGKGDCIIFDDFTMDIKFVSFPFKIKSSAIKILTAKTNVNLYFIYEYLLFLNLISEEHKRHYISEIEPLHIVVPCLVIQHKIAEILQSIDKQIHNARQLQSAYQRQKQYLLNQMFI